MCNGISASRLSRFPIFFHSRNFCHWRRLICRCALSRNWGTSSSSISSLLKLNVYSDCINNLLHIHTAEINEKFMLNVYTIFFVGMRRIWAHVLPRALPAKQSSQVLTIHAADGTSLCATCMKLPAINIEFGGAFFGYLFQIDTFGWLEAYAFIFSSIVCQSAFTDRRYCWVCQT